MGDNAIAVNDVVQIDADDPVFAYCFLTVTEVRNWGVIGYVQVPTQPASAQAFYRVPFQRVVRIGAAEWAQAVTEN